MKCELVEDLLVGGFTEPRGSRTGLGALLVGRYEAGEFCYAGRVGTGFTNEMLRDLRVRLEELSIPATPFTNAIGLPRGARWVRPVLAVRVAFIEWTAYGKMRHPRLLAVVREHAPGVTPA
jgi:bifunctional non-homologous end joining protein LigD